MLAHEGCTYESRGGAIALRQSSSNIVMSKFIDNQIRGASKKGEAVWAITSGHAKKSIALRSCSFKDVTTSQKELKVRKFPIL